jgi:hypothetical protein
VIQRRNPDKSEQPTKYAAAMSYKVQLQLVGWIYSKVARSFCSMLVFPEEVE